MHRLDPVLLILALAFAAGCEGEPVLNVEPEVEQPRATLTPEPEEEEEEPDNNEPPPPLFPDNPNDDDDDEDDEEDAFPFVLVHGFSGFSEFGALEYFFDVKDALEDEGHVVFAPALPPFNDSLSRAEVLAAFIDDVIESTGTSKVHLIAHSQGGIDSRVVVSGMGYDDRVATLTTVATPHRGTTLADHALSAPVGLLNPAGRLLGWMLGEFDSPPNDSEWDENDTSTRGWNPDLFAALQMMSSDSMFDFNNDYPNLPHVPLFSVAGYSNLLRAPSWCEAQWSRPSRVDAIDPFLVGSALVLNGSVISPNANDGIVPSESMVWGTLLGCIPADHFDQVGQIGDLFPSVVSGFDHLDFYRDLAFYIREFQSARDAQ